MKKIKGYELSSKERKILVSELIFTNQYNKLSRSYDIHVPINILFDSYLFKNKLNRSSRDRTREGLITPYKVAYIKFNHVLFECIRYFNFIKFI
jgi:hypothetical protein